MESSFDWFMLGYSIAHCHATCLWNVNIDISHEIEMLAKGMKYTLDNEEKGTRVSLTKGQNSTPHKKERGKIVRLVINNPSDIMHTLSPCTQHLTELVFWASFLKTWNHCLREFPPSIQC